MELFRIFHLFENRGLGDVPADKQSADGKDHSKEEGYPPAPLKEILFRDVQCDKGSNKRRPDFADEPSDNTPRSGKTATVQGGMLH